jgi:hypothetical protein
VTGKRLTRTDVNSRYWGGNTLGKVIYDVSMSLDGFITAANVRPEAGLGDGGEQLHE